MRISIAVVSVAALAATSLEAQAVSRALGEPFAWQVVHEEGVPTVSGTVFSASGAGLGSVRVRIPELRIGSTADSGGRFTFEAPPAGEWLISLQAFGFEPTIERTIVVPPGSGVRIAAMMAPARALCTNDCVGTACVDLKIEVVDSVTDQRLTVPARLRLEFEGQIQEGIPYDPDARFETMWIGLGRAVETVGWHSIEVLRRATSHGVWIGSGWRWRRCVTVSSLGGFIARCWSPWTRKALSTRRVPIDDCYRRGRGGTEAARLRLVLRRTSGSSSEIAKAAGTLPAEDFSYQVHCRLRRNSASPSSLRAKYV